MELYGQDLEEDVLLDGVERSRIELDPALHRVDDGRDHPVLLDRRQRRGPLQLAHQRQVVILQQHQRLRQKHQVSSTEFAKDDTAMLIRTLQHTPL